jgi:choline-sulfatase
MARRGRYKYVYVHGHDRQLFDLDVDPGEWTNLAGRDDLREVERGLEALILERFDPDRIAADGAASVRRRELIRRAMERNGTRWDYEPIADVTTRYVR